jgi:hypothetical protein
MLPAEDLLGSERLSEEQPKARADQPEGEGRAT